MAFRRVWTYARPWVNNSLQIAAIYAVGDFTQQKFISKVKKYDYESTKNVTIVGGCVLSPFYTAFYTTLGRRFPGNTGVQLVQKLVVDQVMIGAVVGIVFFFVAMNILEKKENIFQETIEKGPTAFAFNLVYWLPVMLGIFKKVPTQYQPVSVAIFDFFWTVFLCYYKMKDIRRIDGLTLEKSIALREFEHRPIDKVKVSASEV